MPTPPKPLEHPAAPDPAKPPAPPDPDAGKQPAPKEQVEILLRNGHRLKKKGDADDKWFVLARIGDRFCLAKPVTDEEIKKLAEEGDYVIL